MWEVPVKLIIWDLDDTLWRGTLADGDAVEPFAARVEMVRAFNARGVVNAICSKNDYASARARLEALGIWEEFVFPHIGFTPKPRAIAAMAKAMQLRPANMLFVDDNPLNLGEVRHCLPDIRTLDATAPDTDARLAELLALQTGTRSRVAQYRALESRHRQRAAAPALSNEDFLRSCAIEACAPYLMDNLEFAPRIAELINRSNQLNYTGSRVELAALERDIIDVKGFDSWSIFAWDRHGRHGLIGFAMVDRAAAALRHFVLSCRVMHMGMEAYALGKVREKWPDIDTSAWDGRFSRATPDWIADRAFSDPAIRDALRAELAVEAAPEPAIRIMFDCQSAGIAHFSHYKPLIEFDNYPRIFALNMMDGDGWRDQHFPPFLVYGAAIDYLDNRWPGRYQLLDTGLYSQCVTSLCVMLAKQGLRMLVLLPPEDAPEEKYRAGLNCTAERARAFNALWRRAARELPDHVWVLEVAHLIDSPDEMADVTHLHAGLLAKIAVQVDGWITGLVRGGEAAQAA